MAAILEKHNLQPPLLYGISDRRAFPPRDPLKYLESIFQTRAHVLQWREKDLNAEANRPWVRQGVKLAERTGKVFLVNSHTELALEEGADGVHLTSAQSIAQALQARSHRGAALFVVGKSVHTVREAERAEKEGADYVLLGPVFDPISKESHLPPLGLSALRETAQMLYIPVFALGGVSEATWPEILKTNAVGAAGIGWLHREVEDILRSRGLPP